MIENSTLIKVKNRDNGTVGYTIPDLGNLHRNFMPGEEKEVTMDELRKLSWLPGGNELIENYLIIENQAALQELVPHVEPEYYYTEQDIKNILLAGSLDQLKDCLDFAPLGVIELVKSLAVELKINDLAKRQYILEKTGFNVTNAIIVNEETNKNDTSSSEESHRRAAPINQTSVTSQQRRSPAPQTYKVVSIDSEKE